MGSGHNLLGDLHAEIGEELSPDLIADENTPKAFIWHAIYFNNGLHGLHLSAEEYSQGYERIVRKILTACSDTKVILGLSTPLTKTGATDVLDERNMIVIERNKIVRALAAKYNLEIIDNYSSVSGKPEIRIGTDPYHFDEEGYRMIGEQIGTFLKDE